MSITGRIKTLFFDKNNSEAIFPRTKVKAVSDDENRGLDFLLENIDTQLLNLQGQVNSKAPTGYGLGAEAQFISSNELLSDYSNTGFYRWNAENIDPNKPFSSGEMLAIKRSDSYGQQIAFRADSLQPEIKIRKKTDNKWSSWENWSPSSFAPSGYGLGGANVYTPNGNWDNATENGWYSGRGNSPTGYAVHGFVIKYTDDYIIQQVYSIGSGVGVGTECARRMKNKEGWQPWEWVNPPMVVGVEYRTTQRYEGKPVYVKTINFGTLPASGSTNVSTGISGGTLVELTGTFLNTTNGNTEPYPIIDYEGPKCSCWVCPDCTPLCVHTYKDCSNFTGKFIIKYTKN